MRVYWIHIAVLFWLLPISSIADTLIDLPTKCGSPISRHPEPNLNGPIKTFRIYTRRKGSSAYEATYDSSERMTEEVLYRKDNIGYRHKFSYDSKGYLIKEERFGSDNKPIGMGLFGYDQSSQTRTYSNFVLGRLTRVYVDQYDDSGNHIKRIGYAESGLKDHEDTYRYGESGLLLEAFTQSESYGEGSITCNYTQDGSPSRKTLERRWPSGVLESTESKYIYSTDGVTEVSCSNMNPSKCSKSVLLLRHSEKEQKTIFGQGSGNGYTLYTTHDGLITRLEGHPTPLLPCGSIIYKYPFDRFNNWIKQVQICRQSWNDIHIPDVVTYRSITYHTDQRQIPLSSQGPKAGKIPPPTPDSSDRPIMLPRPPKP